MGYSRRPRRSKLSKYVSNLLNMKNTKLITLLIIITSVNLLLWSTSLKKENNSYDIEFETYLSSAWEDGLKDSPVYASMLGDKRFNKDIIFNDSDSINSRRNKTKIDYEKLKSFEIDKLSEENKLNYSILDKDFSKTIESFQFPYHYMDLNQRGGVQSYYQTASRLVFTSLQDYEDWLSRLEKYSINIRNAQTNYQDGLLLGYTQPKHISIYVLEQIDALVSVNISDNPYLSVFKNASLDVIS